MKHFLKVFAITFICCMLAITAGFVVYSKLAPPEDKTDIEGPVGDIIPDDDDDDKKEDDPLKKAYKKDNRVNFLVLGMEGIRSDTVIFASFDKSTKKVDMISLPRDTYYQREGREYQSAGERKLNAVYGDNGVEGVMAVVSDILADVPIHHYVKVDYKGVEKIVDTIGGVEVNVPFHMEYKDPYDDPPLYINIPKGRQVLKGEQAVKYLRYREGYPEGDIGRVKAQQEFVKSAIKKSMGLKIISVIKTAINYVETDVSIAEAVFLGGDAMKVNLSEDLSMITLPPDTIENNKNDGFRSIGGVRTSYYFYDKEEIENLIKSLYGVE